MFLNDIPEDNASLLFETQLELIRSFINLNLDVQGVS